MLALLIICILHLVLPDAEKECKKYWSMKFTWAKLLLESGALQLEEEDSGTVANKYPCMWTKLKMRLGNVGIAADSSSKVLFEGGLFFFYLVIMWKLKIKLCLLQDIDLTTYNNSALQGPHTA